MSHMFVLLAPMYCTGIRRSVTSRSGVTSQEALSTPDLKDFRESSSSCLMLSEAIAAFPDLIRYLKKKNNY